MKNPYKLEVYQDTKGEWRWRLKCRAKIVADSGEGYSNRSNAIRAAKWLGYRASNADHVYFS